MGRATIIANFGGPRHLDEVEPFLKELLTDHDVVRTQLPRRLHNWMFRKIAERRSRKVRNDYAQIGGKSPIHADTEAVAQALSPFLPSTYTFHRYLPETHTPFIETVSASEAETIDVFPMFPQFTHATTGSIARWMYKHLPKETVKRLSWVRSYADHPLFIRAHQACIRDFLKEQNLAEDEVFLLFSAHGIPKAFLRCRDPYPSECQQTVRAVMEAFPHTPHILAYQSKFGPGEWLRPYTSDVSKEISTHARDQQHVVVIPISFTSDHIETLFEIEKEYLPPIRAAGLRAYRCPALTTRSDWIHAIGRVLKEAPRCRTEDLIRCHHTCHCI